ncbi:hypothetical protein IFM89_001378, partial [Coptis chinensis]
QQQHYMIKSNEDGDWRRDSTWLQTRSKEVPWYLDDGTGCVNVAGADHTSLNLKVASRTFHESSSADACLTYSDCQSILNFLSYGKKKDFMVLLIQRFLCEEMTVIYCGFLISVIFCRWLEWRELKVFFPQEHP